MAKLTFMGANRQVTGSRYCLEARGTKIMIDCGLTQEREFLSRNWEPCPIPPGEFAAMLLTHVHIDHCGLIPKLVRDGFNAPIYATTPSVELAPIMLLDSARIQEEDAAYKKRRHAKEGRTGPHPEIPLYTTQDAERALPLFQRRRYEESFDIMDSFRVRFYDAGHILGAAMIEIEVLGEAPSTRIIFSGDIGQWDHPLMHDPSTFDSADYVIMESTYGDRDHPDGGTIGDQLERVISRTLGRGGNVVVPVFAVERAQELMYYIGRLSRAGRIPDVPIFLDSPMAIDVTEVYRSNKSYLDKDVQEMIAGNEAPFSFPGLHLVRTATESKRIAEHDGPCIIMSTAGMCSAGRIKHHLRHNISRPECTVLFVGFQAHGTLGRQILDGTKTVRIHGQQWRVSAEIAEISGFSAHADRSGLLRWLDAFKQPPKRLFLAHGEEEVSLAFANHLQRAMGWNVEVPAFGDTADLAGT